MTKRRESKPKDPRMLVGVPYGAGQQSLVLLRQTFGPHAPAPILALLEALEEGIARSDRLRDAGNQSYFTPLLTADELTLATPTPASAARIKSNAHQWAKYHGHTVATRSHPQGTQTTVYMVRRARV